MSQGMGAFTQRLFTKDYQVIKIINNEIIHTKLLYIYNLITAVSKSINTYIKHILTCQYILGFITESWDTHPNAIILFSLALK